MRAQRLGAVLACALAGCDTAPDLPPESRVDGPRILAIVSEPPEVHPGEDAALSALLAGFDTEPTREWIACTALYDDDRNRQYQDRPPEQGCDGAPSLALGDGPGAVLPGEATELLFDNLEGAAQILGLQVPGDTLQVIREQVGLPLTIELRLTAQGKFWRAIKRVLVSERPVPHENPPAPRFMLGDTAIVPDPGLALHCTTADGEPARVPAAARVELAPQVADEGEDWIETYQAIDVYGEVVDRQEVPSYAWYVSAGELARGISNAPLRNDVWTTPEAQGCAALWLVVRDGHGGTSACGLPVAVGDADDCN